MRIDIVRILNDVHDHRLPVTMAINEIIDLIGEENLKPVDILTESREEKTNRKQTHD